MISAFTGKSVNDEDGFPLCSSAPPVVKNFRRSASFELRASSCRLLLRHAVQRAESPDQIAGIDRHDLARRKHIRESVERDAIVRIVEHRYQHRAIRDIKIGVAGGQLPAFKYDRTRQRNFDDLKLLSIGSARIFQTPQARMQGGIIVTLLILLNHRDHGIRSDEAGDVIDVAVSVIPGDSAIQPDDGLHAKIVGEQMFISGAIHGRVTLLSRRQQTLLSGDESATSVDVDRSALEHNAVFFAEREYRSEEHTSELQSP